MFLHLPFAVMATLSPVAVSDTMPAFDIAKECRFESEFERARREHRVRALLEG